MAVFFWGCLLVLKKAYIPFISIEGKRENGFLVASVNTYVYTSLSSPRLN